jgi:hypothetical protein
LDCEISAAGHARPGLRAAGDGLYHATGSHALHAAVVVRIDVQIDVQIDFRIDARASGTARDAVPSCDGRVSAVSTRIIAILRSLDSIRQ